MVSTEAIVSIIIACVSLAGTIGLAVWDTLYKASLDAAGRQRDIRKEVQRYKDPLLLAAWELQSRLFDLLDTKIPEDEILADELGKRNLKVFSSYLLAHFLAWAWILRERTQFLAFSEAPHWLRLREVLYKIEDELDRKFSKGVNYGAQPSDRLLVSERAVVFSGGSDSDDDGHLSLRPMRWDEFQAAWDEKFAGPLDWYVRQIMGSLKAKLRGDVPKDQRLRRIQHLLVDLIHILDPDKTMTSDRPNEYEKCGKARWCDCDDDKCWKGQAEDVQLCKNRRERHDRAHGVLKMEKSLVEMKPEKSDKVAVAGDNGHSKTQLPPAKEQGVGRQDSEVKLGTDPRSPDPDLEKGVSTKTTV